ncbi:MAG: hypothetical protein AVDCRST_MAG65-133, partial [uncultured Solirubrobacteraceae bacterium]
EAVHRAAAHRSLPATAGLLHRQRARRQRRSGGAGDPRLRRDARSPRHHAPVPVRPLRARLRRPRSDRPPRPPALAQGARLPVPRRGPGVRRARAAGGLLLAAGGPRPGAARRNARPDRPRPDARSGRRAARAAGPAARGQRAGQHRLRRRLGVRRRARRPARRRFGSRAGAARRRALVCADRRADGHRPGPARRRRRDGRTRRSHTGGTRPRMAARARSRAARRAGGGADPLHAHRPDRGGLREGDARSGRRRLRMAAGLVGIRHRARQPGVRARQGAPRRPPDPGLHRSHRPRLLRHGGRGNPPGRVRLLGDRRRRERRAVGLGRHGDPGADPDRSAGARVGAVRVDRSRHARRRFPARRRAHRDRLAAPGLRGRRRRPAGPARRRLGPGAAARRPQRAGRL